MKLLLLFALLASTANFIRGQGEYDLNDLLGDEYSYRSEYPWSCLLMVTW